MNGAEPPAPDPPASQSESGVGPRADPEEDAAACVITTVVDGNDAEEIDLAGIARAPGEVARTDVPPPSSPAAGDNGVVIARLAAVEQRLAPLRSLPDVVAALREAVRRELDRCAGVLFNHDRGLADLRERLAAAVSSADEMAVPAAAELYEQALGHVLEKVEDLDRRLPADAPGDASARMAGLEKRLAALEPLPAVVQALRLVVREDEDRLAAEIAARQAAGDEGEAGMTGADALQAIAGRLTGVEGRLTHMEALPDDIAALARIVRRELDAVTADVQAREQVLRRALQKEIERLHASAEVDDEGSRETAQRLETVERRLRGTAQIHDDTFATTTVRLESIESRLVSVDGLADDIDALRAAVRRELEQLRTSTQSQNQSIVETGKRFAALDGRLTRLDTLPGEVQALRSAMREEGTRTAIALRSIEDRTGGLGADLASTRETMRATEIALAETAERLDTLTARLADREPPPRPQGAAPAE